jgi:SAM-dependent methyltransferase
MTQPTGRTEMAARAVARTHRATPAALPANIPLSVKFKAWWEGYDAAALHALIHATTKATTRHPVIVPPAQRAISRDSTQKNPPFDWSEQRAAANQLVWGPAFLDPSPVMEAKILRRKLEAKPHHHLMSIGSGLGGFDQLMAKNASFQIDSFDMRRSVTAQTKIWQEKSSVSGLPPVQFLDTGGRQAFSRRYDGLFMTNSLGRVASLPVLLSELAKTLRPGAKFVFVDWFRSQAKTRNETVKILKNSSDPDFMSLTDALETARLCAAHGFTVSENALMTSETVEAITKPWRMVAASLTEMLHDLDRRDLADELLLEAEMWTARVGLAHTNYIEARTLSGTFSGRGER